MDKASVTRMVLLTIALINAVANIFGFNTIPHEAGEAISAAILVIVSIYAGWKNNYLSRKGQLQKKALEAQGLTNTKKI